MQQLGLNNSAANVKKGFWSRQFQGQPTNKQITFDWIFGVGLPVICFFFDPIVFKGDNLIARGGLLPDYKPFAYILSFVSIMAMAAWLVWGARLKWLGAWFAGLFLTSAIISFIVGAVLFPYSVFGLIFLIGALGFTPLFTGIVYLRNGLRAFQITKPLVSERFLTGGFLLAVIFSGVVPYAINSEIKRLTGEMENGDVETIRANARKLKLVAPLVNPNVLIERYIRASRKDKESEETRVIAEVYRDLTGENVEESVLIFD